MLEQYAPDFCPDQIHSLQSISETAAHLIAGRLIESGTLDPTQQVTTYLPEVSAGHAAATVQDVLDMTVINDLSENFYDPTTMVGQLEDAHG